MWVEDAAISKTEQLESWRHDARWVNHLCTQTHLRAYSTAVLKNSITCMGTIGSAKRYVCFPSAPVSDSRLIWGTGMPTLLESNQGVMLTYKKSRFESFPLQWAHSHMSPLPSVCHASSGLYNPDLASFPALSDAQILRDSATLTLAICQRVASSLAKGKRWAGFSDPF